MAHIDYEALWDELAGTREFACYAAGNYSDDVNPDHEVRMCTKQTLFDEIRGCHPQNQEDATKRAYQIMDDVKTLAFENYKDTHMTLPGTQITTNAIEGIHVLIEYFKTHPADDEKPILKAIDTLTTLVQHAQAMRAKLLALADSK